MVPSLKFLIAALLIVLGTSKFAHARSAVIMPALPLEPFSEVASVTPDRLKVMEDLFLEMTNDVREAAGVKPLLKNERLTAVARSHSQDMAIHHYFLHQGPGGDDEQDRVHGGVVCSPSCVVIAETLSETNFVNAIGLNANFVTNEQFVAVAKTMITGLINSDDGHFRAMTDPDLEEMAMGVAMSDDYTLYLTQDYIRRSPMPRRSQR